MTRRPRVLDLFSGAGGAAKGYQDAGFYVVGVDIEDQPNYCGDEFIRGNALDVAPRATYGRRFDLIHASPPCQFATVYGNNKDHVRDDHENLIPATRELLEASGVPYVIEKCLRGEGRAHRPDHALRHVLPTIGSPTPPHV